MISDKSNIKDTTDISKIEKDAQDKKKEEEENMKEVRFKNLLKETLI